MPLPATTVAKVFDGLKGQLGAKVADLWVGVSPSLIEQEWAKGLAGMQGHELRRGLNACATRIFAPTLGEFVRLCRPCLDPEYAFWEARDGLLERDTNDDEGRPRIGTFTHPAVFFAAVEMSTEVRSGDWPRARVRWSRLMEREIAKGWSRKIPVPAMRVNYDATTGPPHPAVRERIARLLADGKERIRLQAIARQQLEQDGTV